MDTENGRKRRRHCAELKAQILAECAVPGASVAKVAMAHGINANIVHGHQLAQSWRARPRAVTVSEQFVPVAVAPIVDQSVENATIEGNQRRGGITVKLLQLADERGDGLVRLGASCFGDRLRRCGWPWSHWTCALAPKPRWRVVTVFGAARPHHAYLFANRRANRMKVLVHDGIGVWLAARRSTAVGSFGPRMPAAR